MQSNFSLVQSKFSRPKWPSEYFHRELNSESDFIVAEKFTRFERGSALNNLKDGRKHHRQNTIVSIAM